MLVDPITGASVLAEATARGYRVGAPIEHAGSRPTVWIGDGSAYEQILVRPARWFVKALFRMHPDDAGPMMAAHEGRMRELQHACDALGRELMIEIVEPEGMSFGEGDLPRLVHAAAADGIEPRWWKLPPLSASDWSGLEAALDDVRSDARIIVLGGGQDLRSFDETFAIAARSPRAAGFAVGRSIFVDAMNAFFAGTATREEIVEQIVDRYSQLIAAWQGAAAGETIGVRT